VSAEVPLSAQVAPYCIFRILCWCVFSVVALLDVLMLRTRVHRVGLIPVPWQSCSPAHLCLTTGRWYVADFVFCWERQVVSVGLVPCSCALCWQSGSTPYTRPPALPSQDV
jgi:hypothetical protein